MVNVTLNPEAMALRDLGWPVIYVEQKSFYLQIVIGRPKDETFSLHRVLVTVKKEFF